MAKTTFKKEKSSADRPEKEAVDVLGKPVKKSFYVTLIASTGEKQVQYVELEPSQFDREDEVLQEMADKWELANVNPPVLAPIDDV